MTTKSIEDAIEEMLLAARPAAGSYNGPDWPRIMSYIQIRTGHVRHGPDDGLLTRARTFIADVNCRFCTGPGLQARFQRLVYVLTHRDPHAEALNRQDQTDRTALAALASGQALIEAAGLDIETPPAPVGWPQALPLRCNVPQLRPASDSANSGPRGSDRDLPRIDSTGTCARCRRPVVYDELVGWIHTGEPPTTEPSTERTPAA